MRVALLLFISILTGSSFGQSDLVINELQAANRHTYVAPDGSTPDWIEVYNAGTSPIDLHGMRFAVVGRQHVMEPLVVAPGEHRLLWFDGRPARGADHMGFSLPRKGGTLLLIAADGITIQDVFTYPAMAGDLSVGRLRDGLRDWTFFTCATPGTPNEEERSFKVEHERRNRTVLGAALPRERNWHCLLKKARSSGTPWMAPSPPTCMV
ncbi:MAG: lamin tail domain-containing protein [Flavobacteriales bacterium]|nr:lamin tail domain-containing protein [Flavobacteriales bacterium]